MKSIRAFLFAWKNRTHTKWSFTRYSASVVIEQPWMEASPEEIGEGVMGEYYEEYHFTLDMFGLKYHINTGN